MGSAKYRNVALEDISRCLCGQILLQGVVKMY